MRVATALAPAPRDDSDINLTPMLDVVFIMLIFFVVTATFVREAGVSAKRDTTVTTESTSEAILIALDPNDDIRIEGRVIDRRALRANLERLHAERPNDAIVVDAAKSSTTGSLVAVMDAARLVGVRVSIVSE